MLVLLSHHSSMCTCPLCTVRIDRHQPGDKQRDSLFCQEATWGLIPLR